MIAREIEKEGIPVALITTITRMAEQTGASRIVAGNNIPYPCGDPNLGAGDDWDLRLRIVKCALRALQTDVSNPTIF